MKLNKQEILGIQKNRDPYLLIDYVSKVVPGKSVEGYKILKPKEDSKLIKSPISLLFIRSIIFIIKGSYLYIKPSAKNKLLFSIILFKFIAS